jgi:hypothetical protein
MTRAQDEPGLFYLACLLAALLAAFILAKLFLAPRPRRGSRFPRRGIPRRSPCD